MQHREFEFPKNYETICQSLMLKFLNASFLYLRFLFLCPILPECVIKRMHRFSLNLFPYMQGFCANTSSIKTLHTCKHEIHKCNESIAEVICSKNSCESTLFKFKWIILCDKNSNKKAADFALHFRRPESQYDSHLRVEFLWSICFEFWWILLYISDDPNHNMTHIFE